MSDKELYSLLCNFKPSTHLGKINRFVKAQDVVTGRCINQLFKLIIQMSKLSDGVSVSQLMMLLSALLHRDKYKVLNANMLRAMSSLHVHMSAIKKNHHIHKIYHNYLETVTDILNAKLKFSDRDISAPQLFAPVLFDISVNLEKIFPYDIQMEAAKLLNMLLEEIDGPKLHESLIQRADVKAKWLNLGETVKAGGDYELQVTLMELIFRMMSPSKRKLHVEDLFPDDEKVQENFLRIQDATFERDGRNFLNMLNDGMEQRMVYSYRCHRVNIGTEDDLQIPPYQSWLDINFGSKTITIFVILPGEEGDGEFDTLIINPKNVLKHQHTVDKTNFHLVLKLNIPVSQLLDSKTGGSSKTVHFVLETHPDPKGAILGLLGQYLPESPKLSKMSRVDVSEETIQICGNSTKIVSTPVSERTNRINQTRQMLSEKISDNLSQFEIGLSQPEKQNLRSFIASEPILTNTPANSRAPRPSPVGDENPDVETSPIVTIPDSLPVSVIPDSQAQALKSDPNDGNWTLQSSFDYNSKLDDSEISAGEDTMKDFLKGITLKEEVMHEDEIPLDVDQAKVRARQVTKAPLDISNLASACNSKSSKKSKKPLKFEESEPAAAVILVGTGIKQASKDGGINGAIKIQNKFDKNMQNEQSEKRSDEKKDDIEIVKSIEAKDVIEIENPQMEMEAEGLIQISELSSIDNSPNLSQELEQINHEINIKAPSSPGDIYKTMLKDGLKESCKEAISAANSPAQKTLQNRFKRRLMDTEYDFLFSRNSQESPNASQLSTAKKLPAFARKRELLLDKSSSFVISKNQSINKPRKREKSDEFVPEEIIPPPPARKSILKKKFLIKDAGKTQTTPKLGKFDFDEKSPAKSDTSWTKTEKKKKRTAGFKTKRQRLEEERAAKRKIEKEKKKDSFKKKFTKRKQKDTSAPSSEGEEIPEMTEARPCKLEIKRKSPSPPPTKRATRYSMRRAVKRINYRDPGSDEDIVSVSASEFSTTTTSTVVKPLPLQDSDQDEPGSDGHDKMPADSAVSLEHDYMSEDSGVKKSKASKKPKKQSSQDSVKKVLHAMDAVFATSSQKSQLSQKSANEQPNEPPGNENEDIEMAPEQAEQVNKQSPISVVQEEEDITCIPSTETYGIPLSFKTDISTLTSMVSKDPSPIIKTNFFKLPTDETKSIKLKLSPQVREISPALSSDTNSVVAVTSSVNDSPRSQTSSGSNGDVFAKVFEEQILNKETEEMLRNAKKYTRKLCKPSKGKKATQVKNNYECHSKFEELQESFDQINQSTILEVAVAKGSDCKLTRVEEEPSRRKEDKVWLEGSESGSSHSAKEMPTDISFGKGKENKRITSIIPLQVTNTEMAVQFHEVSNCMVTEADSTGLLMDIEDCNTPLPDAVREEETASMFSKILEESRLAGNKSKIPSTLVSTPSKLAHIRDAEVANVSPFQQFLEKVGGMKSPIKDFEIAGSSKQDYSRSRVNDSGFDTLGQISCNLSLPIFSKAEQKFSKRPRLKSPIPSTSQSFCGSPPQTNKTKKTSMSPGKQEFEDYFNMLCKTPGKESQQSIACSSQALSDDVAFKSQDYRLPQLGEIKFSPLETYKSPVKQAVSACSTEMDQSEADELNDEFSQNNSFVIPSFMLNTEGGMALQMLQSTSKKMKENQRHKSKEKIVHMTKDIVVTAEQFFDKNQRRRKFVLAELTKNVEAEISDIESNLAEIKKSEAIALRNIALAHKTQREARIALENKMMLLKLKAKLNIPDEEPEDLKEMRKTLYKQLKARQDQADKDLVQKQRQQLLKQVSLLVMSELD